MREHPADPAALKAGVRLWQAALLLGIVVLAAHDGAGLGWSGHNELFDRWLYDGIELLAGLGCLARAVFVKTERGASLAFGLALISTTIGDVLYDFAYGGNPPYPSVADAFYLLFYAGCYVGLGLLLRARISRFSASLWLDGLMAGLTAAAIGSAVLLPVVVASTHGRPLVVLTNLAYPLGDIVLLGMLVFVFAVNGWRLGRAWALMAAALLLNTVGDAIYLYQTAVGTYVEGTLLDVVWPTSLVLIAFSIWQAAGAAAAGHEPRTASAARHAGRVRADLARRPRRSGVLRRPSAGGRARRGDGRARPRPHRPDAARERRAAPAQPPRVADRLADRRSATAAGCSWI